MCLSLDGELKGHFVNALMPNSPSCPLWLALTNWFVCMYTPSPVSATVQTLSSLTQFLSYHRNEKACLSTTHCEPLPLQPSNPAPISDPELPRPPQNRDICCPHTGTAGAFRYNRMGGGTSQWSSVAESAGMDYLFSYWLLFVGFLLLIEGTAWLSWWRPGHKACCELRQRVISLCSWPPEALRKNTACNLWFYRFSQIFFRQNLCFNHS